MTEQKLIEPIDLRTISRDSDKVRTTVTLSDYDSHGDAWLIFGKSNLTYFDRSDQWTLEARMKGGVTDFEHDSAYVLKLPLVGVQFKHCFYSTCSFTAWVDPSLDENDTWTGFYVPISSDYDPTKLEDAWVCEDCAESHPIIPEGYYVPPFNKELYRKVRGKRVSIKIGPAYD